MPAVAASDRVRLVPIDRGFGDYVRSFAGFPEMFRLQFGRAAAEMDAVIANHEGLARMGVQSFLSVEGGHDPTQPMCAHIRVEWRLSWKGVVGLHGGQSVPVAQDAGCRYDALGLAVLAALRNPAVDSIATSSFVRNTRAMKYIARYGFRLVQTERNPDAEQDLAHFRLVRAWADESSVLREIAGRSEVGVLQPFPSLPEADAAGPNWATVDRQAMPVPAGWRTFTPRDAEAIFDALRQREGDWKLLLDEPPPKGFSARTLAETITFDTAHGMRAWVAPVAGRPAGILLARGHAGPAGRIALRGGPLPGLDPVVPTLTAWRAQMHAAGVGRIDGIHSDAGAPSWWASSGFDHEGTAEVDREGIPQLFVAASVVRVASDSRS